MSSPVPLQNFVGIVRGVAEEMRADVLRELRATFINIQKLEAREREDNHAVGYVKSMQCPLEVWAGVVPWLVEEIDAYASSHSSTLQVENTIRVARNSASTNPSQRIDPKALWHSTVFGTNWHTAKERVACGGHVPQNLFSHLQSKGTCGEEPFDGISSTSPW